MPKIVNPALETFNFRLRVGKDKYKYPGETLTPKEAKSLEDRNKTIKGLPVVVKTAGAKVIAEESDED